MQHTLYVDVTYTNINNKKTAGQLTAPKRTQRIYYYALIGGASDDAVLRLSV